MEYREYVDALARTEPALAREIGGYHTLENVMEWMHRRGFSLASIDLVTQDEFTHDFLIPLSEGNHYLVFGIT